MSTIAGTTAPAPGGRERGGRLIPADWPYALRAGIESVMAGWLVVVVPTLAVFVATSSMDAAAALSLGTAVRTGTGLWSLAFGGSWGTPGSQDGVLGLPLLGMTGLQVLLTSWSVRRSRLTGPLAWAWTVAAAVLTATVLVLAAGPHGSRTWPAVLGVGLLTAAVAAHRLHATGRGWPAVTRRWQGRPSWVRVAVDLSRDVAVALAVLVAAVSVAAVVAGAGRVSLLHDALSSGGVISVLGLVLLQIGWVPTLGVWALAWLAGPGFTVGQGSVFAPDLVVPGTVPAVPLLGLLPTTSLGAVGLYLPLVVTAAAVVVAWRRREDLRALAPRQALGAAGAAALGVALVSLLVAWAASGPIGPGRMAQVGPNLVQVPAFLGLEVGVGLVVVAALTHPYSRELVSRGATATTGALGAAAQEARRRAGSQAEPRTTRTTPVNGEPEAVTEPLTEVAPPAAPGGRKE
ncbi:cell division protein PerM [Actinomyces howellii]|uniref:Uncharacterized protein n=1 Tax=Actinomyces howellii TaxID=52771 RepID=A0A448HK13_9ACTO|nr:DUF6350 family protein [Actinomyces howellii]VEG30047.1 Uncharacterised protein [Actinomyces howellii]